MKAKVYTVLIPTIVNQLTTFFLHLLHYFWKKGHCSLYASCSVLVCWLLMCMNWHRVMQCFSERNDHRLWVTD